MSDTTRTEEPRLTLITYRGLIPFGLVAAATIIMFSVASFSFLYASGGTSRAGIRDRGVEVEPELHPNTVTRHPAAPTPVSHPRRERTCGDQQGMLITTSSFSTGQACRTRTPVACATSFSNASGSVVSAAIGVGLLVP